MSLLLSMLTSRCSIARKTETTASATGFSVATWTMVASMVPCSIQGGSARQERLWRSERGVASYTGYFQHGQDIAVQDRISVSLQGASKTLEVVSVGVDGSGEGDHAVVALQEITPSLSG